MATKKVAFEASANLQRLIGRELIPNEEMAIVELVKNAYDSHAKHVRILIQPETSKEPGLIRISDDGLGMSEDEIKRLFMFAGFSQRPDEVKGAKRIPTGEKGIGRFAADKLGDKLEVFTKKARVKNGLRVTIRWKDFEDRLKKFNDVHASYQPSAVPGVTTATSGTVLEITGLRTKWDAAKILSLRTDLADLLNPYSQPTDFEISLEIASTTGQAAQVIDPVQPGGDWTVDVRVVGGRVHRVVNRATDSEPIEDVSEASSADLSHLRGLRARFQYFDKRPTKAASRGLPAGVRVYRDGFRIEPFGSRTADWLHIAETRAKRAGHAHIVPTRLFGFVEISRTSNPLLADTTSRQALLDTPTARSLVTVLRSQLDALGGLLKSQAEPRWEENRRRRAIEAEQARLHTLGVMSFGLAHELRQPLQTIRSEAQNIEARLKKLGVLDRDISEAQAAIDRGVERIDKNIRLVSEISKGSVTDKSKFDLAELVRNEVSVFRSRAGASGIELDLRAAETQHATLNQLAVLTVLANYLQNALEATESAGGSRIAVNLTAQRGRHRVEVTDEGEGVPEDVQPHLFKRFATKKTGGTGVGLYYCKMVVESHGGAVGFTSGPEGAQFWAEFPEGNL